MGTSRGTPSSREAGGHPKTHRRARDLLSAIGSSIAFDHAVEYYDETRGLSPEVQVETARLLADEMGRDGHVLEAGAGTGLITIPLAHEGLRMTGMDLSVPMLERLSEKAMSEGVTIPLVAADVVRLPFADDAFDGVVMRHVLHLVAEWRAALDEVVRVMRPEGTFAVSITDYTGLYHALQERFLHAAGDLPVAVGEPGACDGVEGRHRPPPPTCARSTHAHDRRVPAQHGARSLHLDLGGLGRDPSTRRAGGSAMGPARTG
jgi:SAM-dependent methyltransferase